MPEMYKKSRYFAIDYETDKQISVKTLCRRLQIFLDIFCQRKYASSAFHARFLLLFDLRTHPPHPLYETYQR